MSSSITTLLELSKKFPDLFTFKDTGDDIYLISFPIRKYNTYQHETLIESETLFWDNLHGRLWEWCTEKGWKPILAALDMEVYGCTLLDSDGKKHEGPSQPSPVKALLETIYQTVVNHESSK